LDQLHIERLTRIFSSAPSRRDILHGLIAAGLGLGALWLPDTAASRKGKRKRKRRKKTQAQTPIQCPAACPECQECVNGQTCTPAAHGAMCQGNPCKACQAGSCVNKSNDSSCNGAGKCLNGTCNPRPECGRVFADCSPQDPTSCCSDICATIPPSSPFCYAGASGKECTDAGDCLSGKCVGYRCQ
jgi:hypothetical protein